MCKCSQLQKNKPGCIRYVITHTCSCRHVWIRYLIARGSIWYAVDFLRLSCLLQNVPFLSFSIETQVSAFIRSYILTLLLFLDVLSFHNMLFCVASLSYNNLMILTGTKHPKIKLRHFRKVYIWTFVWLVHKINSLYEIYKLKQNS